ncbi:hypothetical protein CK203_093676 [Vitis vinifera]|uniref:Retrotransposon gag domain-containing protein n=1 Tax=Vitis vinifera TaxID=29760 RepID=A0A438CIF6_VITVI|nr:hypothetical protein CK203_093676 [Vitis vinifera]
MDHQSNPRLRRVIQNLGQRNWKLRNMKNQIFEVLCHNSGSQKSNASNSAQFGVETKKLQPLQVNHSKLKKAFCKSVAKSPFCCEVISQPFVQCGGFPPEVARYMRQVGRAPAGHESAETPIGHESNGAVAGEGVKFIVIFLSTCDFHHKLIDTSCVCQSGYETVEEGLLSVIHLIRKEFELSLNIMEATPEDQHSHQGRQDNLNEFRSMRDRMHPPRMSAPSCIVPPTEQLVIRPYLVPLLPTFHGMESENPYAHIKEFEDVCNTFQEGGASIDLMRLKLFPFTLKDKAKIWLNSLRPRSIRSWTDLQAEFLKKFFPTHRTNGLKRQISNFSAKENEKFYECWERYMEAINACPHHGFDTWLLAGMYTLKEDDDMKAKLAAMTRRLEELELKRIHEVQAVAEAPVQPNNNAPYGNTYNSSWRNHPNFSWKARATQYQQPDPPSQQSSSLEQAIESQQDFLLNPPKPKGVHEVESQEGESSQMKDVKALITLRSGKKIEQPTPKPHVEKEEEIKKGKEMEDKESEISEKRRTLIQQ